MRGARGRRRRLPRQAVLRRRAAGARPGAPRARAAARRAGRRRARPREGDGEHRARVAAQPAAAGAARRSAASRWRAATSRPSGRWRSAATSTTPPSSTTAAWRSRSATSPGHGALAAAVMGQIRQTLRAYAFEGHAPAALMRRLDRLVLDAGPGHDHLPVRDPRPRDRRARVHQRRAPAAADPPRRRRRRPARGRAQPAARRAPGRAPHAGP